MTHVSLFSGIAGFDLAAQWAGFKTIALCEIDPYCQSVLKYHFPGVPIIGDVRDVKKENFNFPITLLTAGVPCQPASCAGKRKGKGDDRWLWPEALRVLREINPAWAVFENPLGITSLDEFSEAAQMGSEAPQEIPDLYPAALDGICDEIEQAGYEVQPVVIPACGVGAPHLRYRIFIIAHSSSAGRPRPCGRVSGDQDSSRGVDAGNSGKDVTVPSSKGLEGAVAEGQTQATGLPAECGVIRKPVCSRWTETGAGTNQHSRFKSQTGYRGGREQGQPESRMGNMADGLSPWLVEPPIPRVATGVKERVNKLKALGNAVVPEQVYPVLKAIADVERSLAQENSWENDGDGASMEHK